MWHVSAFQLRVPLGEKCPVANYSLKITRPFRFLWADSPWTLSSIPQRHDRFPPSAPLRQETYSTCLKAPLENLGVRWCCWHHPMAPCSVDVGGQTAQLSLTSGASVSAWSWTQAYPWRASKFFTIYSLYQPGIWLQLSLGVMRLFADTLRLPLPFLSQLGHSWPLTLTLRIHNWLLGVSSLIHI